MARLNVNRFAVLGVLAISSAVCFSACSDDNNPSPGGPDSGSGASPSTGGKKATGGSKNSTGGKSNADGGSTGGSSSGGETGDGSSATGGSGGETDGGGAGGASGGGGDSGTAPPEPLCKPGATGFFSKTCTDSKCTPFDNSKLQNFKNGMLPPLQ